MMDGGFAAKTPLGNVECRASVLARQVMVRSKKRYMSHRDGKDDSSQGSSRRCFSVCAGVFYCMRQARTVGFPGGFPGSIAAVALARHALERCGRHDGVIRGMT
jgi:hypothetical protein